MTKTGIAALILFILSAFFAPLSFAATTTATPTPTIAVTATPTPKATAKAQQNPTEVYETAKVLAVLAQGTKTMGGKKVPYQKLHLQISNGPDKGKILTLIYGDMVELRPQKEVAQGATVVVMKSVNQNRTTYEVVDTYRINHLYPIAILFLVVVLLVTRLKGLGALIGLGISLTIIITFIVPQILSGQDPLLASIVGSMFIMIVTMYLAHGFSQKTNIALISTSLALVLSGVLSYAAVHYSYLTGLGNGDAANLQFGQTGNINFQGLLLGGIIIGSLGVLEDITTGLAASIQELTLANSRLKFHELVSAGLRIGSEHIAALVNTLVLAYAGVGLPIFLLLVLNPSHQPLWYMLNSELIMEEIVRTLAGSIGLILAVPLTAIFSAWAFHQKTR